MLLIDITLYIFIGVVFFQTIFYLGIFSRFAFIEKKTEHKNTLSGVSVIVCAKNEAKNLKEFLPSIINQNHTNFEIVLINDASHDDSLEVMKSFANSNKNIKIVDVKSTETFWGNKKYALTLGIKAAKHDVLLFIDADCKPVSKYWISQTTSPLNDNKSIVLGYGAYNKIKKSFLNKLIRFETLTTAIAYFSFAKIGLPYMGVGRNLAYTKKMFFDHNGFIDHMNIKSGDDDLFINQAATKDNTAISFSKESFTTSIPETSFKTWMKQKRRHISTAKHYKLIHKILLASFYITNMLFWTLSSILLITNNYIIYIIPLILFRVSIQYIIYNASAKKLLEKDLVLFLPLLEIFLITFQLLIFISNMISKPNHWK